MSIGHAGLVTLIATFVNSLQPSELVHKVFQPIIHLNKLPTLSVLINIVILAIFSWFIFSLFAHTTFSKKLTKIIKYFFLKKNFIGHTYVHDLVTSAGGFGIVSIEVTKLCTIYHMNLYGVVKKYSIMKILAIERCNSIITNLTDETRMLLGDNIISYGKIDDIKKEIKS